jgi:predicted Kef-type K+ transport protein
MEPTLQKKSSGLPIFGVFLILLGAGLVLNKLHVFQYGWGIIFWICLSAVGVVTVVQAFITRRRGVVFWGSLLFFVSVTMVAHKLVLIDFSPWNVPATFALALGLSFLMLFFYDPRRFGVLIPVLFFGGYGVLYYLWWWDVIDWFEMRHYVFTYWPVFVILWGLSLIFRRWK